MEGIYSSYPLCKYATGKPTNFKSRAGQLREFREKNKLFKNWVFLNTICVIILWVHYIDVILIGVKTIDVLYCNNRF